MLDRIENLRRLKEQCERRARLLAVKGRRDEAEQMYTQAERLGWSLGNMVAEQRLLAFAARVEPDAQDQYRLESRVGGYQGFIRGG